MLLSCFTMFHPPKSHQNLCINRLHTLKEDVRPLRGALHMRMSRVHGQVVMLLHGIPVDEPGHKDREIDS